MLTLNDGRSELWQWDTGRNLAVDADCSQVHFSNKVFGRSIDVDVIDGTAIVPDILLQTDKELNVWAFVGTPENGYTKISKTFKVNRRNKPADYVFTPPDQTTLGELKERLDKIEESQDPDAIKNAVEDYLEQNPVEAPVKSVNGKTGTVKLTADDVGAISQDKLQEATNEALAQAKASGVFDGADGKDGKDGYTPVKGVDYFDGKDGQDGKDGKDGYTPQKGIDYFDGEKGETGATGEKGADGYSPVRGTDYWTEADKAEIVEDVLGSIELPTGGGKEWKLICDITIPQEDAAVTLFLDKDSNGNAFSCEEVSIKWVGIEVTDGTMSGKAWISINPTKAGYNQGKYGYMTNDYFYYTTQANYSRVNILQVKPGGIVIIESINMSVANSGESDIHALEISGYQRKAFYGRVIVYGR